MKYQNLTIIIPTKNRSNFLIPLLDYYNLINFNGTIFLADSSDEQHFNEVSAYLKKNKKNFKYNHYDTKNLDVSKSIVKVSEFIETKYCLQISDDDFLFSEGIKDALKFLDNNNNYVGCQGRGLSCLVYSEANKVKCGKISFYRMGSCIENDPLKRVKNYTKNKKNILFAIYRVSIFKKILLNFDLSDDAFKNDFLVAVKALLLGKIGQVKKLYCFHLIFQGNKSLVTIDNYFKYESHQNFDKAAITIQNFLIEKNLIFDNNENISNQIMYGYLNYKINTIYFTLSKSKLYLRLSFLNKTFLNYIMYLLFYKYDLKLIKLPKKIIETKWTHPPQR